MKKISCVLAAVIICMLTLDNSLSWGGETDILIKKLVEKKILSPSEANELLIEIQKEDRKQREEVQEIAIKTAKETSHEVTELPEWIKNTKIKGDLRLRYQYEDTDNDGNPTRDRYRIRLRAGIESGINDQFKVGFGLATGGDDPRSTNETLDNTFDSPDVRLDYAYAQYKPVKWLTAWGGKFKNPIWKTKDMLWDSDIRPEGIAATLKHEIGSAEIFFTPAFFILDEYKADKDDPCMFAFQLGSKFKFLDNMYFKIAGSYYDFEHIKGNSLDHSAETNTVDSEGNLAEEYESFALDAEYGIKFDGPVPFAALFGQYVNSDADREDEGYLAGLKLGLKKVKKLWDWQVKYNYRDLEKDAWLDTFPDSDFYGGATGVKGNEIEFKLGLAKHVTFGIDYYFDVESQDGGSNKEQDLLQADLVLKW